MGTNRAEDNPYDKEGGTVNILMERFKEEDGDTTDEILMERFKGGDSTAFEEIFSRYKNRIYNYAYRFLGNEAYAEEIVQELFFKVIKQRDKYEPRAKLSTWLYTMARNLCIDKLKRRSVRKSISQQAEKNLPDFGVIPKTRPNQEDLFHRQQLQAILQQAVSRLSPEQREVFLMRTKLTLPFVEMADILGVPESTLKSRMCYALKKIREDLELHYNFEDIITWTAAIKNNKR